MRHPLFFLITIPLLFVSCEKKKAASLAESDLKTITISCEKNQVLNLSEFADSIEIIPLETRDDNLIGWVHRIVSTNDCYYLSSAVSYYTQKLFVFGKDGKFIRQIGQEGEAPNAYLGMKDFVLTDDSIIKISENYNLACYDVNGNFLYKRKQRGCPLEIISFNGIIYGLNSLPSSHDNQLLFRLDEKDSLITDFFKISPLEAKVADSYVRTAMLTTCEDAVIFSHPYSNTIFRLNPDNLETSPLYQVDFGDKNVSWKVFEENEDSRIWNERLKTGDPYWGIGEILDLNNHFIINAVDETFSSSFTIYSKKTGKTMSGQRIKDDRFFKGNQVKLKPRYTPHYKDGDYLLWPIKATVFINGCRAYRKALGEAKWNLFCKKYPRLVEVCEQLDEESNPVLLKIKIKDF